MRDDAGTAGSITTKDPEDGLMFSYYTHGATFLDSAWESMKAPWVTICTGDPLAAPFSSTARITNITIKGNVKFTKGLTIQ